jgi:hypothetical protein
VLVYFRNPLDTPVTLSFSGVESALAEQAKAVASAEQEMEQRKSDARYMHCISTVLALY